MERVAIIGNGGGEKSTLARQLAERHGLFYCSVDQVQWAPGWQPAPEEFVSSRLREVIDRDRWVIDGWGPWPSIEQRFESSDTIVFVDLPLWMHFWLAAERQLAIARGEERADPVQGCDDLEVTRRLFETIWRVDQEAKPRLVGLLDRYIAERRYYHLTTLEQLEDLGSGLTTL